jgi:hypothetical protein
MIPVELRGSSGWKEIIAYVDSGASFSIFSIKEARRLGIDYSAGEKIKITVGDGNMIPVYLHRLNQKKATETTTVTVGQPVFTTQPPALPAIPAIPVPPSSEHPAMSATA